jgi:hypothetical protein
MMHARFRGATCASCSRFPIAALERNAPGECEIFEQWTTHCQSACVLYEAAPDKEARRAVVQRLNEQK